MQSPLKTVTRAVRILSGAVLTLFGLLLATFLIARVVPIDPALAILGDRASPSSYAAVRKELGLDRPLYVQFGRYVASVAHGDFGRSALTKNPVTQDIGRFFPATIELATSATLLGVLLGVPAGMIAAARRGRWIDQVMRVARPVRLFRAGVLARHDGVGAVLRRSRLGRRAGAHRHDVRGFCPARHRLHPDRRGAGRRLGSIPECPVASCPAGGGAWLFLLRLYQPHDAQLHAGGAGAGIYRRRARQGLARAPRAVGACVPQRAPAAHHRDRAGLCRAAGRLGADRDGVFLARHRPVHHQFAALDRHERGARRHAGDRRDVHRRQSDRRSAVPACWTRARDDRRARHAGDGCGATRWQ